MNDRIRATARRVKRWDGGTMILRWVLVGVLEAEHGFRRLKGYKHMSALIARLQQNDATTSQTKVDAQQEAA